MLFKAPRRFQKIASLPRNYSRFIEGQGFAIIAIQQRFVIKSINLTWATMHEEKDNSFSLGGKLRRFGCEWILDWRIDFNIRFGFVSQHCGKCEHAKPVGGLREHFASGGQ